MIKITQLTKKFDHIKALDGIDLIIPEASVFGLLGTNGAGKSTLLRILAGIMKQDQGSVTFDGRPVFDNSAVKEDIAYLPDDNYYPAGSDIESMERFYAGLYRGFDTESFRMLLSEFGFRGSQKIRNLSKGMKKQVFFLLSICANTRYILCDEIFDGLDSVVSQRVEELIRDLVGNRKVTFIIASHDLREMDQICGSFIFFHKGRVITGEAIKEMNTSLHKVQCVFTQDQKDYLSKNLELKSYVNQGLFTTFIAVGEKEEIQAAIEDQETVCFQFQPLTLEEIFLYEMRRVQSERS